MGMNELITMDEQFACLIAASCHDIEHPGVNNGYLINTGSPLALRYNDVSVLENFHCARTFEIMAEDSSFNIFESLPKDKLKNIRACMLSAIMATDMSFHFEYVTRFKTKVSDAGFSLDDVRDRQLLVDIIVKCSDVSNPTKNNEISRCWTEKVMEEFFRQGDEERKLGLPISNFMDRNTTNIPKCQMGFIDFIVRPLYEPWTMFINEDGIFPGLDNIAINKEYWKK